MQVCRLRWRIIFGGCLEDVCVSSAGQEAMLINADVLEAHTSTAKMQTTTKWTRRFSNQHSGKTLPEEKDRI